MASHRSRTRSWNETGEQLAHIHGADPGPLEFLFRPESEETPAADYEKLARDCIGYLKKRNRKARIKRLREEICRMEKNGSSGEEIVAKQRLLMQEKVELMKLTP